MKNIKTTVNPIHKPGKDKQLIYEKLFENIKRLNWCLEKNIKMNT